MYVYLCASTPSTTHKSTSTKMCRESSSSLSSIESFECSSLTPTGSVEVKISFYIFRFHFSIFQLRKAVVDHVSDTFVATNVPLIALIDGARRGQIQLVEETAPVFMEHAMKLIEVGCKKKNTRPSLILIVL